MQLIKKEIENSNRKEFNTISEYRLANQKRLQKWIELRQYKQVIIDCEQLILLSKENDWIYYYLGLAYSYLGQYSKALTNWTKAIEINSNYTEAYKKRGQVYALYGKTYLAICDFTEAIKINPQDAKAYFYRALLHHHTDKNYELALADYENTLFLEPKNKVASLNRSIIIKILEKKFHELTFV